MSPGMNLAIRRRGITAVALMATIALAALLFTVQSFAAETPGHRLILKDGTYQSITKYEIQGDRVRYFSAERGEWEEVPKALIDWNATNKYEQGRLSEAPAPEAAELDKEIEAERKAIEARSPQVAPGLRLPDENGVYVLDTYENQPQLVEIDQSGADVGSNTGANILRSAINPLAGSKQTIELPAAHAKVQSHTAVPSLYVNVAPGSDALGATAATIGEPPAPTDRFKIIRLEVKGGKRVAGAVKVSVKGTTKTDERFVPSTASPMTGGWMKITPVDPLPTGEYAVAEMLSKDGMNLYVWDFGVNPAAPANAQVWKPEATGPAKPDAAQEQKR